MKRPSAWRRGYDSKWEGVRDEVVIERGFLCELCGDPVVLRKSEATATIKVAHVDHIKSIAEAPELRLDKSNLRCLCETCHNRRTIADQGMNKGKANKLRTGCDIDGWPTDSTHHWNK